MNRMAEYKLKDGGDMDSIGLEFYLENMENPPLSTPTQTYNNISAARTGIKRLLVTGTLVAGTLAIGTVFKDGSVKLKSSTFSEESVESYSRTVENQFDDYIGQINSVINGKGCFAKNDVLDNIIACRSLNENWDGYGALPLQIKCASNAIKFINFLDDRIVEKLSDFHPNPNGTFSLVWENTEDERLALELGDNTLSYYVKFNSQDPRFFNDIENNKKEVNRISNIIEAI